MNDKQLNSDVMHGKQTGERNAGARGVAPISHFKRTLVPIDEYAARQGVSSDIVEQQGQLGVIQIRKFKGQRYVVDVPGAEEAAEAEEGIETPIKVVTARPPRASKLITAGLTALAIIVVVTVFWLYMDARTRLDDLNTDYAALQARYEELTGANDKTGTVQDKLAGSQEELASIRSRIATSKAELERIEADFSKARRNLETIQSELSDVQGQISLSRAEIEGIQNVLKTGRKDLETLDRQNTGPPSRQ